MPFAPSGITTLVRPLQSENALPATPLTPVRVTLPEGAVVVPTAQPSTSYTPESVAVSKTEALHPLNTRLPTLVTESGMVTFVMLSADGSI